jgi:short-subunit dehydrogenase
MPVNLTLYEGKTALIADASTGIGKAFAEALAQRGAHLILVAPSKEPLQALAITLARLHAVSVEVIADDLRQNGAASRVFAEVGQLKRQVDILISPAEFAMQGHLVPRFPGQDYERVLHDSGAEACLTSAFLPAMRARGRGMVVYGATKAFARSFSRALWAECRQYGVRMLALCLGEPALACFEAVGTLTVTPGLASAPEDAVAKALRALERGRNGIEGNPVGTRLARFWRKPMPVEVVAHLTEWGSR